MKLTDFILAMTVVIAATLNFGAQGFPRPQINIMNRSKNYVMVDGFAFDGPTNGLIVSPDEPGSLRTTPTVSRPFPTLPPFVTAKPSTQSSVVVSMQVPTTVRPDVARCVRDCKGTPEYNPVCGSDGIMYNNPGQLSCARNCGINVSQLRTGRCPMSNIQG